MQEYFDVVARSPLFAGVGRNELSAMLHCLGTRTLDVLRGAPVFLEGDPAESVGMVLSGAVQVVRDDYYGNRSVITVVEEGELFAEIFACANIPTLPVSALAVQDSRVMLMDCRRILTVCSSACTFHTRLIHNLLQAVAQKNLALSQKIQFMSRRTTREKVMAYLLDQAKRRQSDSFTIPYDRQALADYLGVERSAMSAEISKLKKDGMIDCKGSWFRVLSPMEM